MYLGWHVKGIVLQRSHSTVTDRKCLVWSHCICSQEAETKNAGAPRLSFSLLIGLGLQSMEWCCPPMGGPPMSVNLGHPPQGQCRGLSPR